MSLAKIPAALAALLLTLSALPLAAQSPQGDPMHVGLRLVADGLVSPVTMAADPTPAGRLFVVDQIGLIRIDRGGRHAARRAVPRPPRPDGRARPASTSAACSASRSIPLRGQRPLLRLLQRAAARGRSAEGYDHTSHVSELRVSAGPDRADPPRSASCSRSTSRSSTTTAAPSLFGPDGYLYVSLGDGGGANDVGPGHVEDWYPGNEGGNGQDVTENLLGSILRIDVDGGDPYGIPADNPFVGGEGLDEIFAYGFRNPYRFSFDMGGDQRRCFAADAGQNLWEEVHLVQNGGNYGWNVKEGTHCFDARDPNTTPPCPSVRPDRRRSAHSTR
jgi:hypothetical protein